MARKLINLMENSMTIINGRFQSAQETQYTGTIWEDIQRQLNSIGPNKTITQWEKVKIKIACLFISNKVLSSYL